MKNEILTILVAKANLDTKTVEKKKFKNAFSIFKNQFYVFQLLLAFKLGFLKCISCFSFEDIDKTVFSDHLLTPISLENQKLCGYTR